MRTLRTRAKEQLPSVLMTLLSIIQALALELFWSRLIDTPLLWTPSAAAVVAWTQMAVMLVGIVQIWLFYTTMVMRFVWTPTIGDLLWPFAIGILEFTMVDLLGPDSLGAWFYALAGAFALVSWVSHHTYRRARVEPENREFFAGVKPAGLRDHRVAVGAVASLGFAGALLQITGDQRWLAVFALWFAIGLFTYQFAVTYRFWGDSMNETEDP